MMLPLKAAQILGEQTGEYVDHLNLTHWLIVSFGRWRGWIEKR